METKLRGFNLPALLHFKLSSQIFSGNLLRLPSGNTSTEESIDLLGGTSFGFRASQVNVDTSGNIHAGIEEVSLVVDALHHGRSPFSQTSVESPVGSCSKG